MSTYKVLGSDGKEYGPVSAEVLQQWITQKRACATTSVLAEGGSDWKPLSNFPEFAGALAGGPPVLLASPPSGPVQTSGLAIASLVCGVLGFLCLPALAGVGLGIAALARINKSQGQLGGQGLAIAGICLSGFMVITAPIGAGLLLPALARAKAKAQRIHCISNLKQIGLGARMYAGDHQEIFPPDFLSMSNELNTPKVLVCAGDSKHSVAATWAEFDPRNNLSYEYLRPGIAESNAANEVIFRCPIHNNVGMGDGSAQQRPMPRR
jgi:hypothetical protein